MFPSSKFTMKRSATGSVGPLSRQNLISNFKSLFIFLHIVLVCCCNRKNMFRMWGVYIFIFLSFPIQLKHYILTHRFEQQNSNFINQCDWEILYFSSYRGATNLFNTVFIWCWYWFMYTWKYYFYRRKYYCENWLLFTSQMAIRIRSIAQKNRTWTEEKKNLSNANKQRTGNEV